MATEIAKGVVPIGFDKDRIEADARSAIIPGLQRVAGDAALLFAGKKLIDFGKAGLDELQQAQKVGAQTATILANIGPAAGTSVAEVDRLSQAMLQQSGVDDELAKSAENTLLRLGATGDVFRRATQDSNDLAQSFGDMQSDAELLGKALAHPEQAARLLKPAIGGLTDAQLASIKAFQAQGNEAAAQGVILDAVEAKVHGAAEAFGKTLPGEVARSQEELKNMKAELVGGMAPALELGTTAVSGLVHGVEALPEPLQAAVGSVVLLGGGVAALARPVSDVITVLGRLKTAKAAATAADEAVTAAQGASTAATIAQTGAQGGLLSTLGPVALGIGAVAAAGYGLYQLINADITPSTVDLDNALKGLDTSLEQLGQGATTTLRGDLAKFLDQVVQGKQDGERFRDTLNAIGLTTADFADLMGQGAQASGRFVANLAFGGKASEDQLRALGDLVHVTTEHAQKTLQADVAMGRLTQTELDNTAATHLLASGDTDWLAVLTALQPIIRQASKSTEELTADRKDQLSSVRGVFDAEQQLAQAQRGVDQSNRAVAQAQRGVADANRHVEDSVRSLTDAQDRLTEAQDALNKALQPADAETLGKSQLDLADAHLRVGDAQSAVTKAEKAAADARKDGKHSAAEVADLDRQIEEAKNNLQRAIFAETDAEKALQDVQAKGTDQDQAVIEARKQVDSATRGVEDANRNLQDAYRGVEDAQQRVIDAKDAVSAAYLTVADASSNLKDKQDTLFGAEQSVTTALQNQLTAYGNIDAFIAPGSAGRQNLDDYIKNLFVLAGIFQTADSGSFRPGAGDDTPRYVPGKAMGGPLKPRQLFRGAERGPELLVQDGIYQAPDYSSIVLPADVTRDVLDSAAGAGWGGRKQPMIVWRGDVINPAPEPTSSSVRRELQILSDRQQLVG